MKNSSARSNPQIQDLIIGDGPLIPIILRLAGPVVLMMYLQGAYNIIDAIWVGQLLGKHALAGIATGGFVLWVVFGLTNLVAVGVSAILARRIGEGDIQRAEYIIAKGILYGLVLSVFFGIILWFLTPSLFRLMGTGQEVTMLGMKYIRVVLWGAPVIFLSFVLQRLFQTEGDTVTPMWLMSVSLLINTLLDPVLMKGMFCFPELGVAGAALATVIARLLMVIGGILLLLRKRRISTRRLRSPLMRYFPHFMPVISKGRLRLRFRDLSGWDWKYFGQIVRIGLPNAVTQILFPFVYMFITRLPAAFGPEYIAALRIGHSVEGISFFLAMGFSTAAATSLGQNLGANKPDRAANSAWISAGIVVAILAAFSILFFLFARQIGAVFSPDPDVARASATYLRILAVSQLFMGLELVFSGAFSGAGDTVPPMAILVPLNMARIPLAYLLAGPVGLGINGVWWAISGSSIIKGLVITFWFLRGRWKLKKI